jgi:hypothetical protein
VYLVYAPLGVTVTAAVQAVNQGMQARVGALLRGRKFPQVLTGFQSQSSGLHDHSDAFFHQIAYRGDLLIVPVQTFGHRHTHTLPWPTTVLRAFGVAPENAKEVGDLAEVIQGIHGDRRIGASQEVQIEEVFPRFPAQRA